jgi:hypothetical protein
VAGMPPSLDEAVGLGPAEHVGDVRPVAHETPGVGELGKEADGRQPVLQGEAGQAVSVLETRPARRSLAGRGSDQRQVLV